MIVQKDKKILFLHGFYASGQCVPALALKDAFKGRADVLTPDLSIHPKESLSLIKEICDKEHPAVLVGNSCGSFYAQMVASVTGKPALLGNPHFKMTEFLKTRIGEHQFKKDDIGIVGGDEGKGGFAVAHGGAAIVLSLQRHVKQIADLAVAVDDENIHAFPSSRKIFSSV